MINYVGFLQNERFDEKEFKFCESMVSLRRRENLGDLSHTGNYVAPATTRNLMTGPEYQREKRDVETVNYVISSMSLLKDPYNLFYYD